MSSVFVNEPRNGAVFAPGKRIKETQASTSDRAPAEELQLVGEPRPAADTPDNRPGRRSALLQLGGSPLLLYIGTSIAVLATAGWVVSDVSRRHQPMERSAHAAPVTEPAPPAEGPGLLPPARLGDGVVLSTPPADAVSGTETLNARMRETEPAAQAAPMAPVAAASAEPAAPQPSIEPQPSNMSEAPPSQLESSLPSTAEPLAVPEPAPAVADDAQAPPATAKCLLKVGGKVLFQQSCSAERATGRATLKLRDKTLLLSAVRGETWQATYAGKSLGAVYPTGSCWGRKKQVYICAD